MVDTSRRSGLAGIYRAPRNLDQISAFWAGYTKIELHIKIL
jgi:hypothetical protein